MRSLRLYLVFLSWHVLSFQGGVDGFLPYKKALLIQETSTSTTTKHEQQTESQFRERLRRWKKNAGKSFRQSNDRGGRLFLTRLRCSERTPDFFVRKGIPSDMGRASQILADGFFKGNTNWWTYQWERLETYLSLESTFPKPNTPHVIFVACESKSGQILGMAELDARRRDKNKGTNRRNNNDNNNNDYDPYMCNVAVDDRHLRKGIGSALIRHCELQVQQWHLESDGTIPCCLYLKVRSNNQPAIRMYTKLDYSNKSTGLPEEWDSKTGQAIYVMRKELEIPTKLSQSSLDATVPSNGKSVARYSLPPNPHY